MGPPGFLRTARPVKPFQRALTGSLSLKFFSPARRLTRGQVRNTHRLPSFFRSGRRILPPALPPLAVVYLFSLFSLLYRAFCASGGCTSTPRFLDLAPCIGLFFLPRSWACIVKPHTVSGHGVCCLASPCPRQVSSVWCSVSWRAERLRVHFISCSAEPVASVLCFFFCPKRPLAVPTPRLSV